MEENCHKIMLHISSYKHAVEGLFRVYKDEGFRRLFSGATTATGRAALMTVGQLSFYDQIKKTLLTTSYFQDNLTTHFVSSLSAVSFFSTFSIFRSCSLSSSLKSNLFWQAVEVRLSFVCFFPFCFVNKSFIKKSGDRAGQAKSPQVMLNIF